SIKTLAGADPSSSDPVWFVFRDLTNGGTYDIIEVTTALSVKVPSGSTLGTSNSTAFRFWLLAINNAGTVELAVINLLSGTNVYPLRQANSISTTAFGGGGNSAQVPYSLNARASVAYSILGFVTYDTGLTTAGTYSALPNRNRLYIPGLMPLPG